MSKFYERRSEMKRSVRMAVAAVLILTIAAMSLFIIMNSHHEHHEEYCQTCVKLETAIGILKSILSSSMLLLCFFYVFREMHEQLRFERSGPHSEVNPILLKVKLNN